MVKNLPATWGKPGSIPGLGGSPGEGHSNPLQYSCLENSMDRGAWWAIVHGVTKSQTQSNNQHFTSEAKSKVLNFPRTWIHWKIVFCISLKGTELLKSLVKLSLL